MAKKAKKTAVDGLSETKRKALIQTMGQIQKQFGEGTMMFLGDDATMVVEGISAGALSVDLALGGKGLPKGRIIELFGPESSGKTTVALTTIASAQRSGGLAAFIDAEHALDPGWARKLGVDTAALLITQPETAEDCLQIAEQLVDSKAIDVIVIDSVAAMVPRAEMEGQIGDNHVGLMARLMSQALRKLAGKAKQAGCVLIFINQIREKVGVMFGSPETTPGGRALKFYSSCRIDVRRIGPVKQGETIVGSRIKLKVVKNKVAPPFRTAEVDLMYADGVSREGDLVDLALSEKLIEKSGSWFNYGDVRLGQGREAAKEFLRQNPATAAEIEDRVRTLKLCGPDGEVPTAADSDDGDPPTE